ncbi:uncharacterized protein LOC144030829 [Festucalex cinctus]
MLRSHHIFGSEAPFRIVTAPNLVPDLQTFEDIKAYFEYEESDWSPRELQLAHLLCAKASQLERLRRKRLKWEKRAEELEGRLEALMETMCIQPELSNQHHHDTESLVRCFVGQNGSLTSDGMNTETNEKEETWRRKEEKERNNKERAAKEKK